MENEHDVGNRESYPGHNGPLTADEEEGDEDVTDISGDEET
jgi:hypothetical protein